MGQTGVKNNRRLFSISGGDPSLPARIIVLENNEYKILYFASISKATGTITIPTGATILLDQFYSGGDAIVETLVNGQPSEQSPVTAGGAVVSVSSFDASGNYTLSGTPSSYPVALVYILKIKAVDYQNLVTDNIMAMDEVSPVSQTITNGVTDKAPSEDAVYDALALKRSSTYETLLFQGSFSSINLADSTTYYFGTLPSLPPQTNATLCRIGFNEDLTITKVILTCSQGVNYSNEAVSVYLRKDNTTDSAITTTLDLSSVGLNAAKIFTYSVSIPVLSASYYEFKIVTPAFATNGNNSRWHIQLYGY